MLIKIITAQIIKTGMIIFANVVSRIRLIMVSPNRFAAEMQRPMWRACGALFAPIISILFILSTLNTYCIINNHAGGAYSLHKK